MFTPLNRVPTGKFNGVKKRKDISDTIGLLPHRAF